MADKRIYEDPFAPGEYIVTDADSGEIFHWTQMIPGLLFLGGLLWVCGFLDMFWRMFCYYILGIPPWPR